MVPEAVQALPATTAMTVRVCDVSGPLLREWLLEMPPASTLGDALRATGAWPDGSLPTLTGVFGVRHPADHPLSAGDRVEVYAPLGCDPKERRRRRHAERNRQGTATAGMGPSASSEAGDGRA